MKIAISAANEAGKAILAIYSKDFAVEYKKDNSPLTDADCAANEIIRDKLSKTSYPIISEENKQISYSQRKNWDKYWLVDPIDGTKEFIKRNGEFTVNIALIENGKPILGVVFVPVLSTYYLGDNNGAFKAISGIHYKSIDELLNNVNSNLDKLEQIYVSNNIKESLKVVASKSHCNNETLNFISELEDVYGKAICIAKGSSLKLCMVAEGLADFYPRIAPTCEWDTAAAHAVVNAAGGSVFLYDDKINAKEYYKNNNLLNELSYNKENILNPYFIVSGLHKYNT